MKARDYQIKAVDDTFRLFDAGAKGVLNALATGMGKSAIAGFMAQRMDSFLFVVDREELAFQSQKTFQAITGRQVYLECGSEYKAYRTAPNAKCVVAMSQSMIRRKEAYKPDRFEYIFEDECHHSVSPTRTAIRDYFTGKRGVIGFSATPQRLDGKAAGMVYDQVAMKMSFLDGVDLGWLVPFKSRVVSCHDMDLRQFKGSSEYSDKELRKQIEKDAVIEHIARKTIAIADGRQTVIFARTVEQSQKIQQYLKSIGERATHVDGKMHRYMRRDRLHQFAERNFQFVCNCGLIEEGVDVPGIEVVSMAAPMRSTGRFMQRVGRGSRAVIELTGETPEERRKQIAESEKPHFTVIDFIGQMDEHSAAMCFAGDLLAGDFDDETRKVAIRLATGKQNADMRAIIAEARDIVAHRKRKLTPAEEKAAARERYANKSRSAENRWGQMTLFHPFDVLRIDRRLPDVEVPKAEQYGRVLDASTNYLKDCRLRPQEINALTNAQRVYLAKLLRQRAETHGTYPQYRLIHSCGYDASKSNREQAAELAKRCQDAGYIRPAEDGPNQLYLAAQRGQSISSAKDFVFL